jgi:6-phosphogluconate dehydrogenase
MKTKQISTQSQAVHMDKKIGYIGLGKMGLGMSALLVEKGWSVHAYDQSDTARELARKNGVHVYPSIESLVAALGKKRIIWLMIPHAVVDTMLFDKAGVGIHLKKGDIIIDGGNSFFEDTKKRSQKLAKKGVTLVDVGTSGGPAGARHGSCMMVGGPKKAFTTLEQLFMDATHAHAYAYCGESGAGHFVKMVHNGIEYGMMQAIAEGFEMLHTSSYKIKVTEISKLYNTGSVISSRLVGWLNAAYMTHGADLKKISSTVAATGEGAWTVQTAKKMKVPTPVIDASLAYRKNSAKKPRYAGKVLTALRNQFGGHSTK